MAPRLAFVGRELPGLRSGASKRLILGPRSHVGLRTTFGWEPVGLEGGSFFGGSVALVPKEVDIERLGGFGAEGWAGWIGAGEEGAENRGSWVGVVGYDRLNNS